MRKFSDSGTPETRKRRGGATEEPQDPLTAPLTAAECRMAARAAVIHECDPVKARRFEELAREAEEREREQ